MGFPTLPTLKKITQTKTVLICDKNYNEFSELIICFWLCFGVLAMKTYLHSQIYQSFFFFVSWLLGYVCSLERLPSLSVLKRRHLCFLLVIHLFMLLLNVGLIRDFSCWVSHCDIVRGCDLGVHFHLFIFFFIFKKVNYFYFWLHCAACGILVPWPRIEPEPSALEAWS